MNNPDRKKILFLITKSNWGGAQRYVYDIATNLDKTEFEPVVALGGDGPLKTMLEHAHITVVTIPSLERDISLKKEVLAFWDIVKIIRQETPAVVHVNSSKAGGIGALAGRLTGVKNIIFTAHGWAFNEDRPWWQKPIIKFAHWLTILLAHTTVVVAAGTRQQMDWPLVQNKMVVIHPGRTIGAMYNKTEARHELTSRLPALEPHTKKLWIGTIAELHPIKQHPVAIRAVKEILETEKNLMYVIIGEGEERANLEKLITDLCLENNVFLAGNIQEAARFLKAFDIFVLASRSEAYAYVLTEAGLAKVPAVASDVGGIRDTITPEETGLLFDATDSSACADALIQLVNNKTLRTNLGEALHETVSARTVYKMTDALSVLYRHR